MSNSERRVAFAQLHSEVFLPGVGELPRQFDTSPKSQNSKLRGLKMYLAPYGVEVEIGARRGFVPFGNIKWLLLDTAAEAEVEKTKTAKTPFAVTPADRDQIEARQKLVEQGLVTPSNHPGLGSEAKNPVALDEKALAAAVAAHKAQG